MVRGITTGHVTNHSHAGHEKLSFLQRGQQQASKLDAHDCPFVQARAHFVCCPVVPEGFPFKHNPPTVSAALAGFSNYVWSASWEERALVVKCFTDLVLLRVELHAAPSSAKMRGGGGGGVCVCLFLCVGGGGGLVCVCVFGFVRGEGWVGGYSVRACVSVLFGCVLVCFLCACVCLFLFVCLLSVCVFINLVVAFAFFNS